MSVGNVAYVRWLDPFRFVRIHRSRIVNLKSIAGEILESFVTKERDKAAALKFITSKFRPWRLITYLAFSDRAKAEAFERYLKSGSGLAFAKKRLW